MATYQINGTSAVTATSTRNNRGVIRHGGTITGTKFVSDALGEPLYGGGVYDTSSLNPSLRLAMKLFSSGNFARMVAEEWVIKRVTTKLAGATGHSRLLSGAADFPGFREPIHKIHTVSSELTATAIRQGKYDIYSGNFDSGYPVSDTTDHFYNIAGTKTASNDDAATPSRSTPGELVYRTGKPDPVQADYEAKTG